jgi:hypothetical protein
MREGEGTVGEWATLTRVCLLLNVTTVDFCLTLEHAPSDSPQPTHAHTTNLFQPCEPGQAVHKEWGDCEIVTSQVSSCEENVIFHHVRN